MEEVIEFAYWVNSLKSEIRGGVKMYDIKGHYKWVTESELYDLFIIYS